ncbi:hybrid sensor histidine kinase/response regulator transcription factor [Echinicola shivajiensis]|uniref:hybrid sensor histidine kinase/response regulator transcription factor n=1 Tax=Echinicola shivajiensis TaxID=1035916 RepID=UPI001BFC9ED1|nr:hybrid sensor histidine kinase/response regulator transcription factor [Echinicola shivajiensis]
MTIVNEPIFGQGEYETDNRVKFKNISIDEGLSQSSVLCILQDHKGFMWLGTRDGLNRFDGNAFTVYRYNYEDDSSISNNYVKSLHEDSEGVLWVGVQNGLNKYLPGKDAFERITPHVSDKFSSNYNVNQILAANEDCLWLGTNYGLAKYHKKEKEYKPVSADDSIKLKLSQAKIRSIHQIASGGIWIKTLQHIYFFDPEKDWLQEYVYSPDEEPNDNHLSVIYQDKTGKVWLGDKTGLRVLDKQTKEFVPLILEGNDQALIRNEVRSIKEDFQGNLWVGTYKGLYQIHADKDGYSLMVHDENNPNSLSQNSVYSLFEDKKGDLWIGTYAGGISYYDRSFDLFRHFTSGTNSSKLNYKVVSSLVQDKEDNLWVGTEGGGINYYSADKGTFEYFMHDENDPSSISTNNVKALLQDHQGDFWIGTHEGGLNFLDTSVKPYRFKKYFKDPNDTNSLSDNRVISLLEGKGQNIWIGTSGGGLNLWERKSQKIQRIKDPYDRISKIVFTLIKTDDPDIILVGGNRGLVQLNTKTKEIVPVVYSGRWAPGKLESVLSLYLEPQENGKLWVGTQGEGLFCYDFETKKSQHFGIESGLPNNIIYGIVPDDEGNLWISTNSGLARLNFESHVVKTFDQSDGLQSNEFNYGAFLKNRHGELLFGGANGFNIFDPKEIKENSFVPPISITSISVHNKPFLNITDSIKHINLNYDQDVINIDFVALSYSQANKNQYAYMLEGFDKDWNHIGNKHSATYTNLDAGDYIFKVKASNNDGLWNEEGALLPISVYPAPWATWWAYSLYALITLVLGFLAHKYYKIRNKEKEELKQEKLAKERIQEVNQLKLQLFTNISHDFRTPLTLILGPLQRMIKEKKGDEFIKGQHQIMYRNASVLMQLINELLDFRKNESGKLQLKASKNDLIAFVDEVKEAFLEYAKRRNIHLETEYSEGEILLWFDRVKLQKVLFNLLSNAFKFTQDEGYVLLKVVKVAKGVKIVIADSGAGISPDHLPYVFDRFYQIGEKLGSGIGLALSKSMVELHHGSIQVKSEEGKGSSFEIVLPKGKKHLNKEEMVEEEVKIDSEFNLPLILDHDSDGDHAATDKKKALDPNLQTILVTEDNQELRRHLCDILQASYNVLEAADGKEGLKVAKSQSLDLVISDVMMPEMDGMELCQELKTNIRTSHIPVILLTAKTSENYQNSGYKFGADAYITKPFDAEILEIRIRNLIQSRRLLIEKFKKDVILQPQEVTVSSADEEFLKKAISLVEQHMRNPELNATMLVSEMGMSRSVLYRKLKDLTDQSISEFIRTIKLKRAAQLLVKSDLNISEIAFELGFNDQKYFRESFKQLFNCLPSEYRQTISIYDAAAENTEEKYPK